MATTSWRSAAALGIAAVAGLSAQDSWPASSRSVAALRLEELATFRVHGGHIKSCAFAPDGKRMYSLGETGDVLAWNPETWDVAERIPQQFAGGVQILVDPVRPRLAVTGARLFLWDLTAQRLLAEAPASGLPALSFSPDGRWLAHSVAPGRIAVRDAAAAAVVRELVWTDALPTLAVAFATKEPGHLAALSADGTVRTFAVGDGSLLATDKAKAPANVLAFLPDGARLTVDLSGRARWRDQESAAEAAAMAFALGPTELVLAPFRVSGLGRDEGKVRRIDLAQGKERSIACGGEPITALVLRPGTGQLVAACGVAGLRVWEADGRVRDVPSWHTGRVGGLAFSPDVAAVVAAGQELVRHPLGGGREDRCAFKADSVVCRKQGILLWTTKGLQKWTPGQPPTEEFGAVCSPGSGSPGMLRLSPGGVALAVAASWRHQSDLLFPDLDTLDPTPVPIARDAVFLSDRELLQARSTGGLVRLDEQGAELGRVTLPDDPRWDIHRLLSRHGGRSLAVLRRPAGAFLGEQRMLLYDLETNAAIQERPVQLLDWCSLDVQLFVCATPAGLEFLRWNDLVLVEQIARQGIQCLAAASDGRHLAVADATGVHVFRVARGGR